MSTRLCLFRRRFRIALKHRKTLQSPMLAKDLLRLNQSPLLVNTSSSLPSTSCDILVSDSGLCLPMLSVNKGIKLRFLVQFIVML